MLRDFTGTPEQRAERARSLYNRASIFARSLRPTFRTRAAPRSSAALPTSSAACSNFCAGCKPQRAPFHGPGGCAAKPIAPQGADLQVALHGEHLRHRVGDRRANGEDHAASAVLFACRCRTFKYRSKARSEAVCGRPATRVILVSQRASASPQSASSPNEHRGPSASHVRLAQAGVHVGTSSWKYSGWCGQLYAEPPALKRADRAAAKAECRGRC